MTYEELTKGIQYKDIPDGFKTVFDGILERWDTRYVKVIMKRGKVTGRWHIQLHGPADHLKDFMILINHYSDRNARLEAVLARDFLGEHRMHPAGLGA